MICTFLGPRVQRYRSQDAKGKAELVEAHYVFLISWNWWD